MLTKSLNSKTNIKQYSDADYPINPRQPVLARYSADSILNQSVIQLPWSVDTLNAQDGFFISVDGKVLTLGSSNDYVMTAIDSFGFSNQVTLTSSLPAGLNIQAWKMGLKKEIEFAQDQRFNEVYDNLNQSLQGFVKTSDKLIAASAIGTPNTGYFQSSITNRSPIVDVSKDLRVRMGLERLITQNIVRIQDEIGPNGELVFGAVNDQNSAIRFVGNWGTSVSNNDGYRVNPNSVGDFIEITFYGTGLNLLYLNFNSARSATIYVDGILNSTFTASTTSSSAVLSGRNTPMNVVGNVVSGLTLGTHTVKIQMVSIFEIYGFELICETDTLKITPGSSYIAGQTALSSVLNSLTYNSNFEYGSLGTTGGRVTVYQKLDGTIGKAVQSVGASPAYLSSADHSNESVMRNYHWREFGAGRSDDFSLTSNNGGNNLAFTLDNGITTLMGNGVVTASGNNGLGVAVTAGSSIAITFIGTGLDIIRQDAVNNSNITTYSVSIDGTSIGSIADVGSSVQRIQKIVSGLPYGTHTVRIAWVSGNGYNFGPKEFIIYQPKKISAPDRTIELGEYCVLADYNANIAASQDAIARGVLRKLSAREFTYYGTWAASSVTTTAMGGFLISSSTTNDYIQYTFFGTGFEHRFTQNATSSTWQYAVDGVTNLSTYITSYYGAGIASFTSNTGTMVSSTTVTEGNGVRVSGLPLDIHTIKITKTAGTGQLSHEALDIITPIYSPKINIPNDQQNTLNVGSNSILDTRQLSATQIPSIKNKNIVQAVGITSGPTVAGSTLLPMVDMNVTHYNSSGRIRVTYSATVGTNTYGSGIGAVLAIYVNGISQSSRYTGMPNNSDYTTVSDSIVVNVPVGFNKIELYWSCSTAATATNSGTRRDLIVEEI